MEIRRTVLTLEVDDELEQQRLGEVIVTDTTIEFRYGDPPITTLYRAPLEVWALQQMLFPPVDPRVESVEHLPDGTVVWRGRWKPEQQMTFEKATDLLEEFNECKIYTLYEEEQFALAQLVIQQHSKEQ